MGNYVRRLSRYPVEDLGLSGAGEIGSRFAYRIWGGTRLGVKRLPIRLSWSVEPTASGTNLSLSMASNEGQYLFYSTAHEFAFNQRFEEIAEELRANLA